MAPLVRELSEGGVKVNVTALFTTAQVELITAAVKDGAPSYISVFAGRIADAGIDPVPIMARAVDIMVDAPRAELIWASPREILNLVQADSGRLSHHHGHARPARRSWTRSARTSTSSRSRPCRCSTATPSPRASRCSRMKRACVTGGAGFIGSNLADRLSAQGVEVVVVDNFRTGRREFLAELLERPGVRLVEGDVLDATRSLEARAGLRLGVPPAGQRRRPARARASRSATSSRTRSPPRTCSRRCAPRA